MTTPSPQEKLTQNIIDQMHKQVQLITEQLGRWVTTLMALIGVFTSLLALVFPNNPQINQIGALLGILVLGLLIVKITFDTRKAAREKNTLPPERAVVPKKLRFMQMLTFILILIFGFLLGIATLNFLDTPGYWTVLDLSTCFSTSAPSIDSLFVTDDASASIYISAENGRICRSSDNGQQWRSIPISLNTSGIVWAFGNTSDSVLAATSEGEIYQLDPVPSLLGSWKENAEVAIPKTLMVDANDPNRFYLLDVGDGQIYQSADHGKQWEIVPIGRASGSVSSFTMISSIIFAGTEDGELWIGTHDGDTWDWASAPIKNMPEVRINELVVDPVRNDRFYAATIEGIYQLQFSRFTPSAVSIESTPLVGLETVAASMASLDFTRPEILYSTLLNGQVYITLPEADHTVKIGEISSVDMLISAFGAVNRPFLSRYMLLVASPQGLLAWQPTLITQLQLR